MYAGGMSSWKAKSSAVRRTWVVLSAPQSLRRLDFPGIGFLTFKVGFITMYRFSLRQEHVEVPEE